MKGTLKLKKAMSASINALAAMRQGKYFACQIIPVDHLGFPVPKNTKEGREIWEMFLADLVAASVITDEKRSVNYREWHHIDKSSIAHMIWVHKLIEAGWTITGNPNKELEIRQ
jgi:thiamine biosynthesis protein ThiC